MSDMLDTDSFEVESWSELFEFAKNTSQKVKFLKKFIDYNKAVDKISKSSIDKYIKRRVAEIKAEEMNVRNK